MYTCPVCSSEVILETEDKRYFYYDCRHCDFTWRETKEDAEETLSKKMWKGNYDW